MVKAITKEQIAELDVEVFSGRIFVVNTVEETNKAGAKLKEYPFIGFDTETRPNFKKRAEQQNSPYPTVN